MHNDDLIDLQSHKCLGKELYQSWKVIWIPHWILNWLAPKRWNFLHFSNQILLII